MRFVWILAAAVSAVAQPPWCVVDKPSGEAIQRAIDECSGKGGGVAYLRPGVYTTGPIWLKDNVELRLEAGATIALSQNKADWTGPAPALINADGAKNIALTGRGTIDGKAQHEYLPMHRLDVEIAEEMEIARKAGVKLERYYRIGVQKYLLLFNNSQDIRIDGVRLVHSPLWTVRLQDCDRVQVRGVYVYSDLEKGVNADGVNLVSTSNVVISDSTIITGDDSITLKTDGFRSAGGSPRNVKPTENVLVTNCILSSSSTPMMIGTETHADIRHVVFSNIVVRNSNKVFGINVQDGATVSDVRYNNITFELNRRHWNWWGSAEVFKFVLRKRTPESRLGRIENIAIDGAQGTARGTSLIAGHAERPLENITIQGLRVKMLPEERPDKRATHGMVIERVNNLTLRDVAIEWDTDRPEPAWRSALVLRDIIGLFIDGFRGAAGSKDPKAPAIVRERVQQ